MKYIFRFHLTRPEKEYKRDVFTTTNAQKKDLIGIPNQHTAQKKKMFYNATIYPKIKTG